VGNNSQSEEEADIANDHAEASIAFQHLDHLNYNSINSADSKQHPALRNTYTVVSPKLHKSIQRVPLSKGTDDFRLTGHKKTLMVES
jgi:hypothetical protein